MTGVLGAMRRSAKSCSSLCGIFLAGSSLVAGSGAARAETISPLRALTAFNALSRQEIAALGLVLAIVGFSVVAAILLMRARIRSAAAEQTYRGELERLRAESDRNHALLLAEPQIIIAWPAGSDRADIAGDISFLLPQGSPLGRALAFGAWLAPEPSLQLDRAVKSLRNNAESFVLHLATLSGRTVEATGRAIGGQAILRLREISGLRRDLAEMTRRYNALFEETDILRSFATALPWPIWARRRDGTLLFANPAYAAAADATSVDDAISRNLNILDTADREDLARALTEQQKFAARVPVIVRGERRIFDVNAVAARSGSAGVAIDVSEAAALQAELERMADAHRRTLDQLSSGIAVFDARQRLAFYNESYRRLWDLDAAFLDSRPDDSNVLDRLRAARKLPEQNDFRAWKARLLEAYRAVEPRSEEWHLPDGRSLRVVMTPNQEGGVTYIFDDATESLNLERRYAALIRVQRETLDNLAEAVAVFGSNGCARLFNPAFARMWRLSGDAMELQPHIETVQAWCQPLYDDAVTWQTLRAAITGIDNRAAVALKLERKDGSVLECTTTPLSDGATLLTFQDITDTVNVERALRERNDALETADQIKIDFVHHVSYELRSPLTTIIGFAHFLADPSTGPLTPKQSEYLSYITTSTNALLAIINNILDLATIDAGAMTLNLGIVDIEKAIEQATAGIQDRLINDRISLEVDAPKDLGTFEADERRIVQVLYNLLANAVGFAPHDSSVVLKVRRQNGTIAFSVTDAGPGIPPDVQDKVFNWFETHANGSRHRGAGLGLSLVRSFVELHDGRVFVDSVVGKGTTVTCEFPIDHSAHRTAAE
jgi:signal transduction histidine kinase